MRQVNRVIPAEYMDGQETKDTVTLNRQDRYRRRFRLTSDRGDDVLLNFPEPTYLEPGSGLSASDGNVYLVRAAPEDLLQIFANTSLMQVHLAWHLGNRHTPAEITAEGIFIRYDHVLEKLMQDLGAGVRRVQRPFEPVGGAYGGKGALHESHHHHNTANHAHHTH